MVNVAAMNAVKEIFIPFENDPLRLGRLSLFSTHQGYEVQVDVVFEESRKIFMHVGIVKHEVEKEAVEMGLIELRMKVAKK